jgi:tRNA (mo5U34)-methyltransferase
VGKRDQPQAVPDPRIVSLHRRFDLESASVLEIGCFEGVHTAGLCHFSGEVTAIDGRVENVVKTIVRTAMYGFRPTVFLCDVEEASQASRLPEADVVHHVGVLYHLLDPAAHLVAIARLTRRVLMLDTHYAVQDDATSSYTSGGRTYRCRVYKEFGHADVFSGLSAHSRWLLLDDLVAILQRAGLANTEIVERRDERNGARVLLYASR